MSRDLLLLWLLGFALIVSACATPPPAPTDRTPTAHHYVPMTQDCERLRVEQKAKGLICDPNS